LARGIDTWHIRTFVRSFVRSVRSRNPKIKKKKFFARHSVGVQVKNILCTSGSSAVSKRRLYSVHTVRISRQSFELKFDNKLYRVKNTGRKHTTAIACNKQYFFSEALNNMGDFRRNVEPEKRRKTNKNLLELKELQAEYKAAKEEAELCDKKLEAENQKLIDANNAVEVARNDLSDAQAEIDADYLPEGAQPRARIQKRDLCSLVSLLKSCLFIFLFLFVCLF
jgi:hypothetical protein